MKSDVYILNSEEALLNIAGKFSEQITVPFLIFCRGELGAGKTLFGKTIAKHLGVKEVVTSPTFNLIREYIMYPTEAHFIHCDLYRLKDEGELIEIGILDYIAEQKNIIFIEWPELLASSKIIADVTLYLSIEDDDKRRLEIEYH
ncbi:tRNA (adenosine(37)-N6)-threonylcarbamoyltransferase complex ATPase subunit type 1 TsaE [Candidatus Riflebacteria bacterium]